MHDVTSWNAYPCVPRLRVGLLKKVRSCTGSAPPNRLSIQGNGCVAVERRIVDDPRRRPRFAVIHCHDIKEEQLQMFRPVTIAVLRRQMVRGS